MAKNFGKAGSAKAFNNVKNIEKEKAQVIVLQNIHTDNLFNNPNNGEDISFTADLEESMRMNGFTDPMEVTDFGMEDGKYMILSGHRRRAAGVKVGIDVFPCVVRHFDSAAQAQNYTLMANSQRDSAKDPCLYCGRYKLHEDYLESIGFKGSKRDEIAKRLGISIAQADRYNAMNKIILPVWDLVRADKVGMSSVQPMASHPEAEQVEILEIMYEALEDGARLSRETVKKIVDGYREGKKEWSEVKGELKPIIFPMNGLMNTEPGETKDPGERNRNNEVRHDFDPIAAEADRMDAERAEWEREQVEKNNGPDDDFMPKPEYDEDVYEDEVSREASNKKPELTEEEKQEKRAEDIKKTLTRLEGLFGEVYLCKDKEDGVVMAKTMGSMARLIVDEMICVAEEWNVAGECKGALKKLKETIDKYL